MSDQDRSMGSVLVLGLGSYAYGKEKRVIRYFSHSRLCEPVFVLSIWSDSSVEKLLKAQGFRFYHRFLGYLGKTKPWWTLYTLLRMPLTTFSLLSLLRRHRCRGILFADIGLMPYALPAVLVARLLWRTPVALYVGDTPTPNFLTRLAARFATGLKAPLVANSEAVRNHFEALGFSRRLLHVSRNGIVLAAFDSAAPVEFRRRNAWPAGEIIFGFVGQVVSGKGVEDFVSAAERVLASGVGARFVIVGRYDTEPDLVARIRERMNAFPGRFELSGDIRPVEGVYKGVDVVVVASRHREPLPNVAIEAMTCARPVIATRIGGIAEVVQDGVTGILVPPMDPAALAEAMQRLARDAGGRERLGQGGRRRIEEAFNIERTVQEVDAVLATVFA